MDDIGTNDTGGYACRVVIASRGDVTKILSASVGRILKWIRIRHPPMKSHLLLPSAGMLFLPSAIQYSQFQASKRLADVAVLIRLAVFSCKTNSQLKCIIKNKQYCYLLQNKISDSIFLRTTETNTFVQIRVWYKYTFKFNEINSYIKLT